MVPIVASRSCPRVCVSGTISSRITSRSRPLALGYVRHGSPISRTGLVAAYPVLVAHEDHGQPSDIAMIGLGVMGQSLALNLNDNGYRVSAYDVLPPTREAFAAGPAAGRDIHVHGDLAALAASLTRPRKLMLMVPAGAPVDAVLADLLPHLEAGDVVIDGGNSHFDDTARRVRELAATGVLFVGAGVSGGEAGARHGPSIMPGGNPDAWPLVKEMLQAIAARVDGEPCCAWTGSGGAGHYVKMVHNGIEYGDMQLIAEAYQYMRSVLGMRVDEAGATFAQWDEGRLDSYLIEITGHILRALDEDGSPLIEKVLDAAGQKGTGRWTAVDALHRGVPLTLVAEAVFARSLSAMKDERVNASEVLRGPGSAGGSFDRQGQLSDLEEALYASKIVSYAQGFMLLRTASDDLGWELDLGAVAQTWRGGCIIRSRFLTDIRAAYAAEPGMANLMTVRFFARELASCQAGWRRSLNRAIGSGAPVPAMSASLAFYDGYRSKRLPANLIQAQRDYFGAHTYERVDSPRGQTFHTDWEGSGGDA